MIGEQIIIGNDICITVAEIRGNRVSLAINAPDKVKILRKEIIDRARDNQADKESGNV